MLRNQWGRQSLRSIVRGLQSRRLRQLRCHLCLQLLVQSIAECGILILRFLMCQSLPHDKKLRPMPAGEVPKSPVAPGSASLYVPTTPPKNPRSPKTPIKRAPSVPFKMMPEQPQSVPKQPPGPPPIPTPIGGPPPSPPPVPMPSVTPPTPMTPGVPPTVVAPVHQYLGQNRKCACAALERAELILSGILCC